MIRPVVAVTLGDPAGIGPEIILKAARKKSLAERVRLVIVGDRFVLEAQRSNLRRGLALPRYFSFQQILKERTYPCVYDLGHAAFTLPVGRIDARCGRLSLDYVRTAIGLARRHLVEGVVTAPIHKQSWAAAGSAFAGHTEMLAALTRTRNFAMAFHARNFLTVLLSTHLPTRVAIARLTRRQLREKILLTHRALRQMGIPSPRIAVAAVNPHAGEGGLLGDEENLIFAPEIRRCRKNHIRVSGPHSADTVYRRAAQGEFDAVMAPYHDQAMLAVKTLSFGKATNITLGLPFVRTSVDHGTAFDIAGQGRADESALVEAVEQCRALILARRKIS